MDNSLVFGMTCWDCGRKHPEQHFHPGNLGFLEQRMCEFLVCMRFAIMNARATRKGPRDYFKGCLIYYLKNTTTVEVNTIYSVSILFHVGSPAYATLCETPRAH